MRRTFVMVGFALLVGVSTAFAQTQQTAAAPAAQQAAAPQAPAADPFRFATDSGAVIMQVDPAKVADFNTAMGKILQALNSSEKPELKAYGASMKLMKLDVPSPDQPATYMLYVDSVKKDMTYDLVRMVYYSGKPAAGADDKIELIFPTREAADETVKILGACLKNRIPWPLAKVG